MKKLTICIISLLLLVGCTQSRAHYHQELKQAVYSLVQGNDHGEFNLEPLTDFTWDKAELFGPYTPQETIEEHLGIRYTQTGGIESNEGVFLLVFMHENKAVQYTLLDRYHNGGGVDFMQVSKDITPSNDVIKFERKW